MLLFVLPARSLTILRSSRDAYVFIFPLYEMYEFAFSPNAARSTLAAPRGTRSAAARQPMPTGARSPLR
jgi:hypothetical protein